MVNLTVNGIPVSVPEGTTVLDAAAKAGVRIPTLCFMKGLCEIGACRVCVVEVEGTDKLAAACNTPVYEGMSVLTDSPKARKARKTNVELILSQHDSNCTFCVRNQNCALQSLAAELGLTSLPFEDKKEPFCWNTEFPLIRNASKCIKCMRCIEICDKVQTLNVWDLLNSGGRSTVGVRQGLPIEAAHCSLCGQCITHCPVGALYARDDSEKAFAAFADPEVKTVVQIAPAIRGAWGKEFGLSPAEATVEKLTAALRKMGADLVFDTDFTADLTIMEEGSEFLERLQHKEESVFPMFTSCCPGWVRFVKSEYPELRANLSTAKSPHQMFGAVIKNILAPQIGAAPEKIFVISIMPCVSKKSEIDLPDMVDKNGNKDVDLVLTTREVARMMRAVHIDPAAIEGEEMDAPFARSSGAGVIFGATGGVMEAALRTAAYLVTGKNAVPDAFKKVRGKRGERTEVDFNLGGAIVKTAVVSGLGNARALIEDVKAGRAYYDFVEVMACPGGCSGGGGQPICFNEERAEELSANLYALDEKGAIRRSHENPDIYAIYKDHLERPLSHLSHELLHTDHFKE